MALWGKTDTVADVPKYLNAADKSNVYFVDIEEATVAANKAKGLDTSGWTKYTTYTDTNSVTRHKAEVLVAMGVAAADSGDVGARVIAATAMVDGSAYTIVTAGDTDFTSFGAADSVVGTAFTMANAPGTGTGTVSVGTDDAVVADT
jgi:hypothetical protein